MITCSLTLLTWPILKATQRLGKHRKNLQVFKIKSFEYGDVIGKRAKHPEEADVLFIQLLNSCRGEIYSKLHFNITCVYTSHLLRLFHFFFCALNILCEDEWKEMGSCSFQRRGIP